MLAAITGGASSGITMRGMCHHNSRGTVDDSRAEGEHREQAPSTAIGAVRRSCPQRGGSLEMTSERHTAVGGHGIVEFLRPRAQEGKTHSKIGHGNRRE